jgi:hypothetical protein
MESLFPGLMESVSGESEEAHVVSFYVVQALSRIHFPEPKTLTRVEVEVMQGEPRYHVPYEQKEIRLWCVPVELQVFPPRIIRCRLPSSRPHSTNSNTHQLSHHHSSKQLVVKPLSSTVTDISRLGFDISYLQSFVFIPVTRLGFDTTCLLP